MWQTIKEDFQVVSQRDPALRRNRRPATSRMALVLAARLALLCFAELHVVHAEDPLLSAAADRAGIDLVREKQKELDQFIAEAWPASQSSPQSHVVAGPVVDVILDVARQHNADLVVVGGQGNTGQRRFTLGSVASKLAHHATTSLLIVRED